MKADLRGSLFFKVCALFLLGLFSAVIVYSAFGAIFLYSGGAYEGQGSFFRSDVCEELAYDRGMYAFYDFQGETDRRWIEQYNPQETNFGFEIFYTNNPETPLLSVNVPEKAGYTGQSNYENYTMRLYVSEKLTAQDSFFYASRLYQRLLPKESTFVWTGAAASLGWLVLLVFLCCAAGHRRGEEQIIPNCLDVMPFDLWLSLAAGGCALCLMPIDFLNNDFRAYTLLLAGAGVVGILMLTAATILTFATRVKLGRWWRNTIIYKLLRFFWRMLKGIWNSIASTLHALPLIWKTLLLAAAFMFLQSILTLSAHYSAGGATMLMGLDIAALWYCSRWSVGLRGLLDAGAQLAGGNPDFRVDTHKMQRTLRRHGENLNSIGGGIAIAVDERTRSERMKTELITNVSHDIKTPLTSILNYVDLLQKDPTPEEQKEYLAVLDRQARRLKKLTEDLVEASKAATGSLQVELERTDLSELLRQAAGEYEEKLSANELTPVLTVPEEPIFILADGRLLWRVIDNLLSNACKYAQPGTRVYLDARRMEETAVLTVRNISRQQLNVDAEELMERFVRGDSSRNTEGSGLGLNIAKSLSELQNGTLNLAIDGDLFKATVSFAVLE